MCDQVSRQAGRRGAHGGVQQRLGALCMLRHGSGAHTRRQRSQQQQHPLTPHSLPQPRHPPPPAPRSSLGFAGTMLVRSEEEIAAVKAAGPLAMLAQVGWPWESEAQRS